MDSLPQPRLTPSGFMVVDDAGPDLLRDLLRRYDHELATRSPRIHRELRPGLDRRVIEERFAAVDLVPAEEVVVWWEWHDGFTPGFAHGYRFGQFRLDQAIRAREMLLESLTTPPELDWIHVTEYVAVTNEPLPIVAVRGVYTDPTTMTDWGETPCLSLCTPVTFWLTEIEQGWTVFDEQTGYWRHPENGWDSPIPIDWGRTGLA